MRPRLRALHTWLYGEPAEPTVMELPALDADGDPCWLTICRVPLPHEREWATSADPDQRAAYAIHAVTLARETAECAGYRMGWRA